MTSEKRPTFPIGLNAFLINDGKILLSRRTNVTGTGEWGLPGGHLEKGETFEGCLARELREELGVEIKNLTFAGIVNLSQKIHLSNEHAHYVNTGFRVGNFTGEIRNLEPHKCSELRWFNVHELPSNIFFGHAQLIDNFKKGILFGED